MEREKYNRRPHGRYNRDVDGPNKRRGMKNKAEAHENWFGKGTAE